eukprot:420322-Hanusia_phi.AAC.2
MCTDSPSGVSFPSEFLSLVSADSAETSGSTSSGTTCSPSSKSVIVLASLASGRAGRGRMSLA